MGSIYLAILFGNASAWWTVICLLLGLAYATFFYKKQLKTSKYLFYILFVLRAILVFLIAFMLLAPLWQSIKKRIEKPLIIIAKDNSESIKLSETKNFNLTKFNTELKVQETALSKDYEVIELDFGNKISKGFSNNFADKYTDISELFSYLKTEYGEQNIGAIVIASDGIYNKGLQSTQSALFQKSPIFTIALGDTIPKKDLLIQNISHNKLAYLGDEYEIEVELSAHQSKGNGSTLNVSTSDGQKLNFNFSINDNDWRKKVKFKLFAKQKGIQKINFRFNAIDGEISTENNQQTTYVEVIDGREKVLMIANAPHPDLSAIKQSLAANKNYEVEIAFADKIPKNLNVYNLFILHNLPSAQNDNNKNLLNLIKNKPTWFILGTQIDAAAFNQSQNLVDYQNSNGLENYNGALNNNFSSFSLTSNTKDFLAKEDALNSSLIPQKTSGNTNILLLDKTSQQAIWSFYDQNGVNSAILLGEGLWRWRLNNYKTNGNFEAFDELINKTVQLLAAKDDKRKFRVYPSKNNFNDNEAITLNAELYNDAFEPIKDAGIGIDINNSEGKKFSYQFSSKDDFYELDAGFLPAGEYHFLAQTTQNGKKQNVKGQFLVEKTNAELLNTTANHQVLYQMAKQSNGEMLYPDQVSKLADKIRKNEQIKTVSYEDKSYEDLIDLKWLFALLVLLLSTEWFLRKRNGVI